MSPGSSPHQTRTLIAIFLTVFLGFCAVGAVVPVMPGFVHGRLHGGDIALAIVMGAEALTAILGRPIAGQVGRRTGWKRLLLAGAALTAVAGLSYTVVNSVPTLILTRLLLGVGAALMLTSGGAWTVAIAPAERRGQALGLYGLAMWAGFAVGPLIGDALWRLDSYPAVWTFAVLSPLAGCAVAAAIPYQPPAPVVDTRTAGGSWTLFPRPVVRPGIALSLAATGYSAVFTFGVLFISGRGWSGGATLLSLFGVCFVATRAIGSRLPDLLGPTRVASAAAICEMLGLLLILVAPERWIAFAGAGLVGGGLSMVYPSLALIAVNDTAPEERGVAIGAFTSFFDLATLTAGVTLGPLAAWGGYGATLWAALACAGASAILSTRLAPRERALSRAGAEVLIAD
jgi:predicted MFS family arabinose efflux permease